MEMSVKGSDITEYDIINFSNINIWRFNHTIMSSLGYISISAIVVLAFPRPIDPEKGLRNVVFDVNFYITQGSQTLSMALLRYFAADDMLSTVQEIGRKDFQKALIVANVCSHFFLRNANYYFNLHRYLRLLKKVSQLP